MQWFITVQCHIPINHRAEVEVEVDLGHTTPEEVNHCLVFSVHCQLCNAYLILYNLAYEPFSILTYFNLSGCQETTSYSLLVTEREKKTTLQYVFPK